MIRLILLKLLTFRILQGACKIMSTESVLFKTILI